MNNFILKGKCLINIILTPIKNLIAKFKTYDSCKPSVTFLEPPAFNNPINLHEKTYEVYELDLIERAARLGILNNKNNISFQDLVYIVNEEEIRIRSIKKNIQKLDRYYSSKLLRQAKKYKIPYDSVNVDFEKLDKEIVKYKENLKIAEELGIYWNISLYDPTALIQAIEIKEKEEKIYNNHLYWNYRS